MADNQPPQTGTTQRALSAQEVLLRGLQLLTDDKFRKEAEKALARALANQSQELLQTQGTVTRILAENLPFIGGQSGKDLKQVAVSLVPAVVNAKKVANGDLDTPVPKATGADPVDLATGQLAYKFTDLRLDGAGIAFEFTRTYRSQARYPNGPLGACWDYNLNLWLREASPDVIVVNSGELREDRYKRVQPGGLEPDYFAASASLNSILMRNAMTGQFELRLPDGTTYEFSDLAQFDATAQGLHRIERIFDRFQHRHPTTGKPIAPGNYLHFHYDANDTNLLVSIEVNHPQRLVTFEHDDLRRITVITDYTGRQVRYTYDDYDDLVAVTLPAAANHPFGRSTFYQYSSARGGCAHQLLSVIDSDGRRYFEVEYGIDEGFVDHERVIRQRDDEGDWFLEYADIVPARDPTLEPDPNVVEHYTVVRQPNGHHVEHWFNGAGNRLFMLDEYIDEEGVKQRALSRSQYNPDGQLVASLSPERVFLQDFFGRDAYMLEQGASVGDPLSAVAPPSWRRRLSFGNHLGHIRRANPPNPPLEWPSNAMAANIENVDPDDIIIIYAYEPDFQLLLSSSDPRATTSLSKAQASRLTLYTYGPGNHKPLASITYPATTSPDGAARLPSLMTFNYDDEGRLLKSVDTEGHITTRDYFGAINTAPKEEVFSRNLIVQPMVISTEGFLRSITAGTTEPDEATTRYEVNRRGGVTKVTDALGAVSTIRIDSTDQPLELARTLGNGPTYRTRFAYTANVHVRRREREVQDDLGNDVLDGTEVHRFTYNDSGLTTRETIGNRDPRTWLTTRHVYNADGLLTRTISPGGTTTHVRQNARRLAIRVTEGFHTSEATSEQTVYDNDGRKKAVIDGRGNVTRYDYDRFGRLNQLVEIVDGPAAAPLPIRDRQGHTRVFDHDKQDNVVLERMFEWSTADTYFLLQRVSYAYDELGRKIREVRDLFANPLNAGNAGLAAYKNVAPPGSTQIETWLFRDGSGRVVERREGIVQAGPQASVGSSAICAYDHVGRMTSSSTRLPDRNNLEISRTVTSYDLNGNPIRVDCIDFEHAADDAVIATEVIARATEFDTFNRRVAESDGLGNTTRFRYDSRDLLHAHQDPTGKVVTFDYDVYGRRTRSTETVSKLSAIITTYSYDADGQVTAVVRGDSLVPAIVKTAYAYNAIHKETTKILAAGTPFEKQLTSRYDAAGNLTLRIHPNGLREVLAYDQANRLKRVVFDVTTVIPPNPPVLGATVESFVHDGLGRVTRAETDAGATVIETQFDSLGRPTLETQTTAGQPSLQVSRSFDPLGNRARLRYPSGRTLDFAFDSASRLLSIHDTQRGNPNVGLPGVAARILVERRYIGSRRRADDYANGTSRTDHHDAAGRCISIDHSDAAGSLLHLIQMYDSAGDRRRDWQAGTQAITLSRGYEYDDLHRLTTAGTSAAAVPNVFGLSPPAAPANVLAGQVAIDALLTPAGLLEKNYTYDAGFNRVAETVSATATAVDVIDQQIARSYDDNGNTIASGGLTLRYDTRDRLVNVAGGTVPVLMMYDAVGRRVSLQEGGSATRFIFDGVSEIAEYKDAALETEHVVAAPPDGRIRLYFNQEDFIIHSDLVGSTRMVTDSAGAIVGRWEFDSYGITMPVGIDLPPYRHRFMGRQWDAAIGLYHFRTRHYDPSIGCFIQRDSAPPRNSRSEYQGFASNPLTYVDPMGTRESHTGEVGRTTVANNSDENVNVNDSTRISGGFGFLGVLPHLKSRRIPWLKLHAEGLGLGGYDREKGWYVAGLVGGGVSVGEGQEKRGVRIEEGEGTVAKETAYYPRTGRTETEALFLADIGFGKLKKGIDFGIGGFVNRNDPREVGLYGYVGLGSVVAGGGPTIHLKEDPSTTARRELTKLGVELTRVDPIQVDHWHFWQDWVRLPNFARQWIVNDAKSVKSILEAGGIETRFKVGESLVK